MTNSGAEDEVKNHYLSSMGNELGAVFFLLYKRLVELNIVWQQYRQLYGTDRETVQLLNRTSGLFFKIIQDELWNSVLLGISRMTDPVDMKGRKNLTIHSLPVLIGDSKLKAEVQDLCNAALDNAGFAREHRNKRIAHQDNNYNMDRLSNPLNGVSREQVESMLESLSKVMNHIDIHFRDTTVMYGRFIDQSGARVLVSKLKKLDKLA